MKSYLTAEVSAAALRHNAALLRRRIGEGVRLGAVVKADAYGHGLAAVLGVVADVADALVVAAPAEAVDLRDLGYTGQVLVLFSACAHADGAELREALAELIRGKVTLTIVSAGEVGCIAAAARRLGTPADVHVMIDTGMGRSGAPGESATGLIDSVRREPGLRLTGLYTHFAAADEADKTPTREQLARFLDAVDAAGGREGLILHAANSAATIDLPEAHLDMVRAGIALYGCQPSDELLTGLPLRPCLRLTAPLMQIKTLPAGSRCGYGLTYRFPRNTPVGLVPVGYADGYPRRLTNDATMRIRGLDVPVRGRVSMDQTIVDLTGLPDARIGDEVEIISSDPAAAHSIESLARRCGTIPYELTCRLGGRVRRVLVD